MLLRTLQDRKTKGKFPIQMSFDYDFAVIGGGSGGMAAAKEAASLGAKVILFDYVNPSPMGTKWGVGGTCVNVGCIPKKLFHYSGLLGESFHDASHLGWKTGFCDEKLPPHDWSELVSSVTSYIKKLNFSYRNGLRSAKVNYINGWASLDSADPHRVLYTQNGEKKSASAKHVVIAVGGRPTYPDIKNAKELAITSDDIFYRRSAPGKTLVVGGGYIAMECAGFLTALGYDTTVSVRSTPLRSFDHQIADKIVRVMTELGTQFLVGVNPISFEKDDSESIKVKFDSGAEEVYDTVLLATGRTPETASLNLPTGSVLPSGKIAVDADMRFGKVGSLFAIGDVVEGRPELTPVAIKDGELLARRLFGEGNKRLDRPDLIPTTVFTPIEYGCIGLSEESAIKTHTANNIESYLYEWQTLERAAVHRPKLLKLRENEGDFEQSGHNFCKIIVLKGPRPGFEPVLGFHYVGPNAGEVTQGFAVAMRLGMTKQDLDDTIGIHPTDAEAIVGLTITKTSGLDFVAAGGCGGGKCG